MLRRSRVAYSWVFPWFRFRRSFYGSPNNAENPPLHCSLLSVLHDLTVTWRDLLGFSLDNYFPSKQCSTALKVVCYIVFLQKIQWNGWKTRQMVDCCAAFKAYLKENGGCPVRWPKRAFASLFWRFWVWSWCKFNYCDDFWGSIDQFSKTQQFFGKMSF
jgi:hypothetical protein